HDTLYEYAALVYHMLRYATHSAMTDYLLKYLGSRSKLRRESKFEFGHKCRHPAGMNI
ncbi:2420_t:CDS:2, partial [Funneliformis mosseae]